MPASHELGRNGEALATEFLREHGYEILAMNWRSGKAEVDVIAAKSGKLCLIEVKTRSGTLYGDPQDFVSMQKQRLLIQAAEAFIASHPIDAEVRFDIIAIKKQGNAFRIEHIKNAFSQF
jgi:putative endonuclease